ncbi:MAG: hypothetical protein QME32_00200 [Endomicrobiia bacterium]|nr:hypothetical protein [Endomicrobiia bacterium]
MKNKDEIKEAFEEMIEALIKAFPGFLLSVAHRQYWLDTLRKEKFTYFDVISGTGSLIHNPNLAPTRITLPLVIESCLSVRRARAEKEWQALKSKRAIEIDTILTQGEKHRSPFVRGLIANTKALLLGQIDKKAWAEEHKKLKEDI